MPSNSCCEIPPNLDCSPHSRSFELICAGVHLRGCFHDTITEINDFRRGCTLHDLERSSTYVMNIRLSLSCQIGVLEIKAKYL